MSLGERVKAARLARGLSLREAADEAGVSHSAIARVERGEDCLLSTAESLWVWLGGKLSVTYADGEPGDYIWDGKGWRAIRTNGHGEVHPLARILHGAEDVEINNKDNT